MQPVDIVIGILAIITLVSVLVFVPRMFIILPFVPTPMPVVRTMIEMAELRGNEVIYDLGAGDARFLIEAKKRYPNITAKGCELAPMVWLWAKIRIWWSGQDIEMRLQRAQSTDVSDADALFLFLLPMYMGGMEKKFDAELKKGTKVLSHAFRFPNREPQRDVTLEWKKNWKKHLLLYIW